MNSPTILVVDDVAINTEVVQSVLSGEGFRTLVANDGPTARILSRAEHPDLILLDVLMPGESGFETCALLKSDPVTVDIPIIFLSALDDVKSKVTGLRIGGVDYVPKPVSGEELLARVRVHLRIRDANRILVRHERARLDELRLAQQALLVNPTDCPEACFAVFFQPLEAAGGDFYDVVQVDSEVFGYFVADVSGHGVSAAFLTSAIKALLRQYCGPLFSPEDTMRGIDSVMRQMLGEEQYLTACYARLNRRSGRLTVVSAGHPPLILADPSGSVRPLEMDGDPLGLFSSLVLHRRDVRVSPGDRFYLYSDGLIEASPGGGRQLGLKRLAEACARQQARPLAVAVAAIAAELRPEGATVTDDLLLLGVEVPK